MKVYDSQYHEDESVFRSMFISHQFGRELLFEEGSILDEWYKKGNQQQRRGVTHHNERKAFLRGYRDKLRTNSMSFNTWRDYYLLGRRDSARSIMLVRDRRQDLDIAVKNYIAPHATDQEKMAFLRTVGNMSSTISKSPRFKEKFPELETLYTENLRWRSGEYIPVPWSNEPWNDHTLDLLHRPHISKNDPKLIAYTQTFEKFKRDIQTPIKPGRYLQKYYPHLSEAEVKRWADKVAALADGPRMHILDNDDEKWADSPDSLGAEWVDIYGKGPHSCMKGNLSVAVYGLPGNHMQLIYWTLDDSVVARTIARSDRKEYVRIYASDVSYEYVRNKLDEAGYKEGCISDLEIRFLLENGTGNVYMPYLDNSLSVDVDFGDDICTLRGEGYGQFDGQNSDGYLNDRTHVCECCGDRVDDDDVYYTPNDEVYCPTCYHDSYVEARSRNGYWSTIAINDAIFVGDTWYDVRYLSDNDIVECDICGEFKPIDDTVRVHGSVDVCTYHARVVSLDEEDDEGNDYAIDSETIELTDGRIIHESVQDDYLEFLPDMPEVPLATQPNDHQEPLPI